MDTEGRFCRLTAPQQPSRHGVRDRRLYTKPAHGAYLMLIALRGTRTTSIQDLIAKRRGAMCSTAREGTRSYTLDRNMQPRF